MWRLRKKNKMKSNTTISTLRGKTMKYLLGIFITMASLNSFAQNAYITNYYDDNVSVINLATNTVTATVAVGSHPFGVSVSPDGSKVYVSNQLSGNVSVINTTTNTVTATVAVGTNPRGVSVSPDGSKVYVANYITNNVSVINTATNTVTATVAVGTNPYGVSVSPDGSKVYVGNAGSNDVSVINTATNTVTATVAVGTNPFEVSVSPDGSKVYVANNGTNNVSVINTATNIVTATLAVGNGPIGVSVSPDGSKVYVANFVTNNVSVINTATNTVTATVAVGNGPFTFGNFIATPPSGGCPLPSVPVISGPSVICGITHPVYAASSTGATSYTWTTPSNLPTSNMVINSGQGTSSITTSVTGSNLSGNVMCTANNSCGTTAAASYMVTKKPQTPTSITGPTDVCGITSATYSIPATFGATSYTWTIPAGMTLTAGAGTTSVTVTIASTFTLGAVKVMAVNACGSVPGTTLAVYGKTPPSTITGPTNVCSMTTATYTCNTVVNAVSYGWQVPASWTFTGQGTNTIIATMPANINNVTFSGVVRVHSVNTCGNSADKTLTVSYCKSGISMNGAEGEQNTISSIYPNPAQSEFTIDLTSDVEKEVIVEIYDVLGNKIIQQKHTVGIGQSSLKTNVQQYQAGMYFVRLLDMDNTVLYTQRVIKE